MGKTVVKDTIIKSEVREADGAKYQYSLIMTESNKVASYKLPLYSIEVEMTDSDGKVNTEAEILLEDI